MPGRNDTFAPIREDGRTQATNAVGENGFLNVHEMILPLSLPSFDHEEIARGGGEKTKLWLLYTPIRKYVDTVIVMQMLLMNNL